MVHINAYAKFSLISSIHSQGNEILTIMKGHYSAGILRKLTHNNPYLDLVKVNAYAKFDQIPSIRSQDIERKQTSDNQGP